MTTTIAVRTSNPVAKIEARSDRGESTFNVLLYIKCSKMAARMLRLVLLNTQVNNTESEKTVTA